MHIQAQRLLQVAALGVILTACGKPPAPPTDAASSEPAASAAPEASANAAASEPASTPLLPRTPAPDEAKVAILSPAEGAIVTSPVTVVFGLEGMTLAPAGDSTPQSGHHHLLVDVPAPDLGQPIPTDAQHLHFGKAQTEAEITLEPGQHTLQLLLGDANHVPHDPPVISAPIVITVQ